MTDVCVAQHVMTAAKEMASDAAPLETGGILLGYAGRGGVTVVLDLVGPGPAAISEAEAFEPDHEWRSDEIERLYRESDGVLGYLGDWHSHPTLSGTPSRRDIATLKLIAGTPAARAPSPIMGIVEFDAACDHQSLRVWRWDPIRLLGVPIRSSATEAPYRSF